MHLFMHLSIRSLTFCNYWFYKHINETKFCIINLIYKPDQIKVKSISDYTWSIIHVWFIKKINNHEITDQGTSYQFKTKAHDAVHLIPFLRVNPYSSCDKWSVKCMNTNCVSICVSLEYLKIQKWILNSHIQVCAEYPYSWNFPQKRNTNRDNLQ